MSSLVRDQVWADPSSWPSSTARTAISPKRIYGRATRRNRNPLKTTPHAICPAESLSPPCYTRVESSMFSTAVQCSVRLPDQSLRDRIFLPTIYCSIALSFDLCSPGPQSAARIGGNLPCAQPPAGLERLFYINSLILKIHLGSSGQILAPPKMRGSAQNRPIMHNCGRSGALWDRHPCLSALSYAQPARTPWSRLPRPGSGGLRGRRRLAACPTI